MPLELDQLRDSTKALADLLLVSENQARMEQFTEVERDGIRAGVIQNFEVTYELAWKLIDRWLKKNINPEITRGLTRREFYRLAAQLRLIPDMDTWMRYHEARNLTSHRYNRKMMEQVYQAAKDFPPDAQRLFATLDARND